MNIDRFTSIRSVATSCDRNYNACEERDTEILSHDNINTAFDYVACMALIDGVYHESVLDEESVFKASSYEDLMLRWLRGHEASGAIRDVMSVREYEEHDIRVNGHRTVDIDVSNISLHQHSIKHTVSASERTSLGFKIEQLARMKTYNLVWELVQKLESESVFDDPVDAIASVEDPASIVAGSKESNFSVQAISEHLSDDIVIVFGDSADVVLCIKEQPDVLTYEDPLRHTLNSDIPQTAVGIKEFFNVYVNNTDEIALAKKTPTESNIAVVSDIYDAETTTRYNDQTCTVLEPLQNTDSQTPRLN